MARYQIIDSHDMANPRLGQFGRILTPEETEAKFAQVWSAAFDKTHEILTNSYEGKAENKYPTWNDFKQTL